MANVINWFEIPAKNFERACEFYGKVLVGDVKKIHKVEAPGKQMGMIPGASQGDAGGAIVKGKGYEPTTKGSLIYLNGGDNLSKPLSRVEKNGGKVVVPKTSIGENGFMAIFHDTEGNRVALHSMK